MPSSAPPGQDVTPVEAARKHARPWATPKRAHSIRRHAILALILMAVVGADEFHVVDRDANKRRTVINLDKSE